MKVICLKDVHNEKGFPIYDKDKIYEIDPITKNIVNSTGESDSFWKDNPDKFIQYFKPLKEDSNTNKEDKVNHPKHYTSHPSGIECIEITKHYNFCIGNAIKYLWRHGLKSEEGMSATEKSIQDLEKAIWYIKKQISDLQPKQKATCCNCGGHNVEIAAWVNANTNEYCSDYGDPFRGYCNDCDQEVSVDYDYV